MRKLLVIPLVVAAACGPRVKQDSAQARGSDPSVAIAIESNGAIVWKAGVLICPLKVTNHRTGYIQIMLDRCEVETQTGERRRRRVTTDTSYSISPGASKTFKIMFGDPGLPLKEGAYRIWLWIQATDGSGLIEKVPPLNFGSGEFANPPAPFSRGGAPAADLPPPTDPPPPPPVYKGETYSCPQCGEQRPKGSTTCPHCGLQ